MANRDNLGLPFRPFLYTTDQIADLLQITVSELEKNYLHFDGRTIGIHRDDKLLAANIAPADCAPNWRIEEQEFLRWIKNRGIRIMFRSDRRR